MCHVQLVLFTTKSTKDTKVSDISGLPPKAVKREFLSSFGRFALKSSLLRALQILRGENIFTANPEEPNNLAVAADADLAADDVSDQSDDDDNERCQKGDHGAALELPAEGIIERQ